MPIPRRPDMLPVAHAAAFGLRMDRLRPLAGRAGEGRDGVDQIQRPRVPGPQANLRQMDA